MQKRILFIQKHYVQDVHVSTHSLLYYDYQCTMLAANANLLAVDFASRYDVIVVDSYVAHTADEARLRL